MGFAEMAIFEADAEQVLATFPGKIEAIRTATDISFGLFPHASLSEANEAFLAAVTAKASDAALKETEVNVTVAKATTAVREELGELIEKLLILETWLTLSVPMVADGNNFGVEIQEYMVKTLKEKKDGLKALFDGLNKYSTERGDLWGKAIFPTTEKRSSSKGVKKSSGGEKETNETTESE